MGSQCFLSVFSKYSCHTGGPANEAVDPIIFDGDERRWWWGPFEVEEVLAERMHRRKRQVLVKWAGFDALSATWEPI